MDKNSYKIHTISLHTANETCDASDVQYALGAEGETGDGDWFANDNLSAGFSIPVPFF